MSLLHPVTDVERLAVFRGQWYECLTRRRDALFELTEALLCAQGPVRSPVELSLVPEYRRGHGSLYDGINAGRIEFARVRYALAGLPLPRVGKRIVLAVDVSAMLRPDAETSPERLFCQVQGRAKGTSQMIPGWPYSIVVALGGGRSSWTAPLDAIRLGPDDDATAVTAAQLREVVQDLIEAGHWRPGDPDIEIVTDTGYDVTRLAFLLDDLPVVLIGRLRSGRVMSHPAPERPPAAVGRSRRHGPAFGLDQPATWSTPDHVTSTETTRYGTATASAWHRLHPRLTRRSAWLDYDQEQELPIIEGTLIRLAVDHLPGDRTPKPLWLWTCRPCADAEQVDQAWQAFLRRFDIEHTFRFFKQTLGWTTPKIRNPEAADRWTWLIIVAYTQLRLARTLITDLRHPWERPRRPATDRPDPDTATDRPDPDTATDRPDPDTDWLTPARVRRGIRYLRPKLALPAGAPKPTRPGPGRPPGSPNRHRAPRHDVGKTTKRDKSLTARHQSTG